MATCCHFNSEGAIASYQAFADTRLPPRRVSREPQSQELFGSEIWDYTVGGWNHLRSIFLSFPGPLWIAKRSLQKTQKRPFHDEMAVFKLVAGPGFEPGTFRL